MVLGVEQVGNYKITKMGDGRYAVALTNGNMGAFITDEKGLLEFKKKHNLNKDTLDISTKTTTGIPDEIRAEQQARIQELLEKNGRIDPRKDKVYYNAETGKLDTWKPGIYDPESQQKNADRRLKVAGLLTGASAIAAAVLFRKPLMGVLFKGVEFIKPVAQKGLEVAGKAVNFVKDHAQGLIAKAVKFFGKGTTVS